MSTRKFLPATAAVLSAFALVGPAVAGAAVNPWTAATNAEQVGATAALGGIQAGAAAATSGWTAGANALGISPISSPGFGGIAQIPTFGNQIGSFNPFMNYGPTGPLGPLGAHGPLGNANNLPTGMNAWNLGPTGPLGPGGLLG
jgi:hypothetical protein